MSINPTTVIGVTILIAFGLLAYFYHRLKIKNSLSEAELKQKDQDTDLNKKANEAYLEKVKTVDQNIGDSIDPSDPWAGV